MGGDDKRHSSSITWNAARSIRAFRCAPGHVVRATFSSGRLGGCL